jgi:D-beta-D-heptose 7-phosphate kinase / D-beta-D-heptose 1-phosphate adenosyltransferase
MQNLEDARVLVVGDVMLDEYWEGNTQRISPEAPVPVVHVQKQYFKAGGAANVALNIAALQGQVFLLGLVGDDEESVKLEKLLKEHKVHAHLIKLKNTPTIKKLRVLSQHQQLIRTDFESNLADIDKAGLLAEFKKLLKDVDVVIISDYGKGTLSKVIELIKAARVAKKAVLVDPKNMDFSTYQGADIITPNFKEFEVVVGNIKDETDMEQRARKLIHDCHLGGLLVTRGAQGMSFFQEKMPALHVATKAQEVFDVTGAGDTVIAVLGMALAIGLDIETSIHLANTAAGIVVGKMGTATVTPEELHAAIQTGSELPAGILKESVLKQLVLDAKHRGETIVMTNGCFDILHAGHVDYLNAAKKLGDRLIVAVNSDASVKKLKGKGRPVNKLEYRMQLLAALKSVDWVVAFSEDTPERLIEELLPDVLVKAADYQVHEIAGGKAVLKNGGQVKTLPLTPGCSTTSIIKKIQGESS